LMARACCGEAWRRQRCSGWLERRPGGRPLGPRRCDG
jgi:hypothetical protein